MYEVIVSGSEAMMSVWIIAWSKSGNMAPVRFFNDGTWSEKLKAECSKWGVIEDVKEIYEQSKHRLKDTVKSRDIGWMCKPLIMAQAKSEYAVWVDHDVEIQKSLDPIVEYVEKNGAWFASPYYESFAKGKYGNKRLAQHGIIVYKPADERMKTWKDYVLSHDDFNDETNFVKAFGGLLEARKDTCDLYHFEWYESTDTIPITKKSIVAPRLSNSDAIVVHWTGSFVKEAMVKHILGKNLYNEDVDAVFVLGSGSKHKNLELRIALRSMEQFCPWIRKVWVVGDDPGFLSDKVRYIKCEDKFVHCKDANIIFKIHMACKEIDLAERFLFCSDDQFVMKHCVSEDFEPRWLKIFEGSDYGSSVWFKRLRKTLERFGNGSKYFQPHIWALMNKSKFLDMCSKIDYTKSDAVTVMSLYFNYVKEEGVKDYDHVYLHSDDFPKSVRHYAYGTGTFDNKKFREKLLQIFPTSSVYESDNFMDLNKGAEIKLRKDFGVDIVEETEEDKRIRIKNVVNSRAQRNSENIVSLLDVVLGKQGNKREKVRICL